MKTPTFRFDEIKHKYYLDDELLPGVTTILGTLAKPALIQWAANCAVDFIQVCVDEKLELTPELLKDARTAHAKKRDKAADAGTDVHALCEEYIKSCIAQGGEAGKAGAGDNEQVRKFVKWAQDNKVVFGESEKKVYSPIEKYAGTVDFTATVNGKRLVGDIKTTSGIYDLSPLLQCAAYQFCLEEMGETGYEGSVIIRLGKDGSFEEFYRYDSGGEDKQTFLSLLKVYRALTKFKNQNKK